MKENRITTLIVDDNKEFAGILEKYLAIDNISADIANDGQAGLQKYMECPNCYDVILLDIQMPSMNGYEVLRRIRETWDENHEMRKVPVIAMSGSMNGKESSLFDYILRKPFSLGDLLSMIHQVQDAIKE